MLDYDREANEAGTLSPFKEKGKGWDSPHLPSSQKERKKESKNTKKEREWIIGIACHTIFL